MNDRLKDLKRGAAAPEQVALEMDTGGAGGENLINKDGGSFMQDFFETVEVGVVWCSHRCSVAVWRGTWREEVLLEGVRGSDGGEHLVDAAAFICVHTHTHTQRDTQT